MLAEAIRFGVAAGHQQPDRDGPNFNHSGRRWRVKIGDHAERHQRALVAIHGHGFVRAAWHVGGHFSHLRRHRRSHGHPAARIHRPGKRRKHEPGDHKDRQQSGKVDRDFHRRIFSRTGRQGNRCEPLTGSLIRQNSGADGLICLKWPTAGGRSSIPGSGWESQNGTSARRERKAPAEVASQRYSTDCCALATVRHTRL